MFPAGRRDGAGTHRSSAVHTVFPCPLPVCSVTPSSAVPRGAPCPAVLSPSWVLRWEREQRRCVASGCPGAAGSPCVRLSACLSAETGSALARGANPSTRSVPCKGQSQSSLIPWIQGGFGASSPLPASSSSFFLLSCSWETRSPALRRDRAASPGLRAKY